jgi:hypothetical protein
LTIDLTRLLKEKFLLGHVSLNCKKASKMLHHFFLFLKKTNLSHKKIGQTKKYFVTVCVCATGLVRTVKPELMTTSE